MKNFASQTIDFLFQSLKSSTLGLSSKEAHKRFLDSKKSLHTDSKFKHNLKLLIRQFTNPLILLLVAAVIISAILQQTSDALIILFILIASALLSFIQELNAGKAVEKLKQLISLKHDVLRDGKITSVATIEVVPGDVLILNAGDIIPADCRIIECNELHINESALTGETFPSEKTADVINETSSLSKQTNCLWQGTNVVSGTCKALVINTGKETIYGNLIQSLREDGETAFEKDIKKFGYLLLKITIVLSLTILIFNIYFHKPLFESLVFSLALAVGMAPELLPAIMTFAMSAGAKKMMQKKVIVKKLSSIFNFSEVTILCTDKTGTITEGTVCLKDIVDINNQTNDKIKLYAYINAFFQQGFKNPLDEAILSLKLNTSDFKKTDEIPYDFIRKRLSILVIQNEKKIIITKGAVPNILSICAFVEINNKSEPLTDSLKEKIEETFSNYSGQGIRTIALCYKEVTLSQINRTAEENMTFLGFVLLEDPIKDSVLHSIEKMKSAGIAIKIITGDNRYAANYIAKKIDIHNSKILTGQEIDQMSLDALKYNAIETNIFAEVEPQHKERIVRALQNNNNVVAYMGDGINDVSAIHAADVGISTDNAVDVAKDAADFVLMEKDLSVLVDGVIEGRKSFTNSMKYIFINTGATFGNMVSVAGASLILPFLPMLPKQILLTNFITDFPYLSVSSDNVDESELKQPLKWNLKLIIKFMIVFGIHSSLFDFLTFYVLFFYFKLKDSPFQTGWFIESVITELLILFIIRTKKSFLKSMPGKALLLTSLLSLIITIVLPISPFADLLGLSIAHTQQAIAIFIILILYLITADLLKIIFFKKINHEPL